MKISGIYKAAYGYSETDLREKFEAPQTTNRLRDIEDRWRGWPKLMEKIKAIRAR